MTLKRWDGASWIDLTTLKRWDGVSWVDITLLKRWDGVAWIDIPLPGGSPPATVSVTLTRGFVFGSVTDSNLFTTVTSQSTTATAAGGTGPYTYSWAKISGDSAVIVSNPSASSVNFSANVPRDSERAAVYRVTATDSLGATGTANVSISLLHNSDL